jgi:acetylornithine/succinyldiaminopimelate/putrescine aminotransferase
MCDTLVATGEATADGASILAKNSDRHPNKAHIVEYVPRAQHERGLMMGLKLASENLGPLLTLAGFQHGVLTIYANQLLPPLTIEAGEVEQVLDRLDRMLAWVGTVASAASASPSP